MNLLVHGVWYFLLTGAAFAESVNPPAASGMNNAVLLSFAFLLILALGGMVFHSQRLNRKLKHSLTQLALLSQRESARQHVFELLSSDAPLAQILTSLIECVEKQNPQVVCSILLTDKTGKRLRVGAAPNLPDFYKSALHNLEISPHIGSCGSAVYHRKRCVVEDIQLHPNWRNFRELAQQANLRACWAEPILASNGKALGAFAIYHREPRYPQDVDSQTLEQAAQLASVVIQKIYSAEDAEQSHHLLQKISMQVPSVIFQFRISASGHASFPFISQAVRKMYGVTPEELAEDASPFFSFRHPDDAEKLASSMRESAKNLTHWQIEYRLNLPGQGTRWRLGEAQPERQKDGSTLWHGFIADITERKKVEERIQRMAQFDALTELPNRALFTDRLQQALASAKRDQTRLGLMFLDLDKFKPINDTLGHAVGDILLKRAAARMQSCMRESDTVARIGGDEFVVLLPIIQTVQDASIVAEKVRQALEKPFDINGHLLQISASIGIALYPEHGENDIQLAKNADAAMYVAKQQGRNNYLIYNDKIKEHSA